MGGAPKGPSQASIRKQQEELQRAQDLAMQKERDRLAAERAAEEQASKDAALASLEEAESRRRAFAGTLSEEGDDEQRRKFLKSA